MAQEFSEIFITPLEYANLGKMSKNCKLLTKHSEVMIFLKSDATLAYNTTKCISCPYFNPKALLEFSHAALNCMFWNMQFNAACA